MIITEVWGFNSPVLQVLCENPLKNCTATLSAFFSLRTSSIPKGIVVPAAQDTIAAGCVSGPVMCTCSAPKRLNALRNEEDFPVHGD